MHSRKYKSDHYGQGLNKSEASLICNAQEDVIIVFMDIESYWNAIPKTLGFTLEKVDFNGRESDTGSGTGSRDFGRAD